MILTGDRQQEIITRATNRLVTAMIYMTLPPGPGEPLSPKNMGMIVEKKKPGSLLTLANDFIQSVQFWQWEDECFPAPQKNSDVIQEASEKIKIRTARVNKGEFSDLETQKTVFNSTDIVSRATGVPSQMHVDFADVSKTIPEIIDNVPFRRLKQYLGNLQGKLQEEGGSLIGADIRHADAMSAFDYYEKSFGLHMGRKLCYGDVMLAKANNLLGAMGMPFVSQRLN